MALEDAWTFLKAPAREAIPDSNIHFVTQFNRGDRRYRGPEKNIRSSLYHRRWGDKPAKIPWKLPQVVPSETPEEPEEAHWWYGDDDFTRIMRLTPNQFLRLTGTEDMDYSNLDYHIKPMKEAMEGGEPVRVDMPQLTVTGVEGMDKPGDMEHDGRHRMAALASLGHGDTPVPVHITDWASQEEGNWQPPEEAEIS